MGVHGLEEARAAKKSALKILGTRADVVGVGITRVEGGYGVKVNLCAAPRVGISLPDEIDGVPLRFEVVGQLQKRAR